MKTMETYRLWPNGTWDKVEVEIMADPWTLEIVELLKKNVLSREGTLLPTLNSYSLRKRKANIIHMD